MMQRLYSLVDVVLQADKAMNQLGYRVKTAYAPEYMVRDCEKLCNMKVEGDGFGMSHMEVEGHLGKIDVFGRYGHSIELVIGVS